MMIQCIMIVMMIKYIMIVMMIKCIMIVMMIQCIMIVMMILNTSWLWWWSNASWLWCWSNASWLWWWSNRLYSSWRGDLTLAVSLTTPNEYPWNCQWPVARWLPRGGVRWGKPHEISNFNCWGFPQPAQLPHLVTKRGNRVGARGDWCGIPWPLGGLWGLTLSP